MKKLKTIQIIYWSSIFLAAVFTLAAELFHWQAQTDTGHEADFYTLTLLQLLTLVAIPLVLRFHKTKYFKRRTTENPDAVYGLMLGRFGVLYILMAVNLYYYNATMHVAYFYLAVILLLGIAFICPTKDRIIRETQTEEEE